MPPKAANLSSERIILSLLLIAIQNVSRFVEEVSAEPYSFYSLVSINFPLSREIANKRYFFNIKEVDILRGEGGYLVPSGEILSELVKEAEKFTAAVSERLA